MTSNNSAEKSSGRSSSTAAKQGRAEGEGAEKAVRATQTKGRGMTSAKKTSGRSGEKTRARSSSATQKS